MRRASSFCIAVMLCSTIVLFGQQNNSNLGGGLFIPSESSITVFGNLSFSKGGSGISPGIVTTFRHHTKKGILHFAESSKWNGTSESQYVDGYAGSFHNESFMYPIGQNNKYRPAATTKSFKAFAAYYEEGNRNIGTELSNELKKIHKSEYWHINVFEDSKVILTWIQDSYIDRLLDDQDIDQLTIVGFKDGMWREIASDLDPFMINTDSNTISHSTTKSNKNRGSITTTFDINAEEFQYFTLGIKAEFEEDQIMEFTMSPNPQILNNMIEVIYELPNKQGGQLLIFSSDNQLLHIQKIEGRKGSVSIDAFKESGSFIVGVQDNLGKIMFKNIIIVD